MTDAQPRRLHMLIIEVYLGRISTLRLSMAVAGRVRFANELYNLL